MPLRSLKDKEDNPVNDPKREPSISLLGPLFYIYLFLRDRVRQSEGGGGAEREGDTESEAGSRLSAFSPEPDAGLELTNRRIVT